MISNSSMVHKVILKHAVIDVFNVRTKLRACFHNTFCQRYGDSPPSSANFLLEGISFCSE